MDDTTKRQFGFVTLGTALVVAVSPVVACALGCAGLGTVVAVDRWSPQERSGVIDARWWVRELEVERWGPVERHGACADAPPDAYEVGPATAAGRLPSHRHHSHSHSRTRSRPQCRWTEDDWSVVDTRVIEGRVDPREWPAEPTPCAALQIGCLAAGKRTERLMLRVHTDSGPIECAVSEPIWGAAAPGGAVVVPVSGVFGLPWCDQLRPG